MYLGATGPAECATQRFPVHRDRGHRRGGGLTSAVGLVTGLLSGVVDQPVADRGVQQVPVDLLGQPPHCGLLGCQVTVLASFEPGIKDRQHPLRGIGDPFPNRGERARTRQHRRRGQRQQRPRRVPHTPPSPWIRHRSQIYPQVSHLIGTSSHSVSPPAIGASRSNTAGIRHDFHHGHGSPTIMRHQQSHDQSGPCPPSELGDRLCRPPAAGGRGAGEEVAQSPGATCRRAPPPGRP